MSDNYHSRSMKVTRALIRAELYIHVGIIGPRHAILKSKARERRFVNGARFSRCSMS
jgi:hypothetical protein